MDEGEKSWSRRQNNGNHSDRVKIFLKFKKQNNLRDQNTNNIHIVGVPENKRKRTKKIISRIHDGNLP